MPIVVLKSGCVVGVVVMVVEVWEVEEEVEQVTHTGQGVEEIVDVTVEGEREDEEAMAQGKTEQNDNCDAFLFQPFHTTMLLFAPLSAKTYMHALLPGLSIMCNTMCCVYTQHIHISYNTHTHTHHSQHIHISHNTHTHRKRHGHTCTVI